jgi:hypothetical protein
MPMQFTAIIMQRVATETDFRSLNFEDSRIPSAAWYPFL